MPTIKRDLQRARQESLSHPRDTDPHSSHLIFLQVTSDSCNWVWNEESVPLLWYYHRKKWEHNRLSKRAWFAPSNFLKRFNCQQSTKLVILKKKSTYKYLHSAQMLAGLLLFSSNSWPLWSFYWTRAYLLPIFALVGIPAPQGVCCFSYFTASPGQNACMPLIDPFGAESWLVPASLQHLICE